MNAVSIAGLVTAFGLVFLWLLALCAEKGVHPFRRVRHGCRRLPVWEKTLLSIFVGVWIAFASVKDGTNQMKNVELKMGNGVRVGSILHSPLSTLHSITDDDIALGWRVASVSSNVLATATFTMPTNATVWESAQASGRGWGAWRIPLDGWHFTYGDDGWTNGFAWVEGYFRSKFRGRANEIRLLNGRLTLCPAAHWSRYNLAASRAWCATNDVDGLVVTFENAAVGDDPTKIVSVQMELFPRTGEVALRYDLANVGDAIYAAGLVIDGTNHFVEVGAGTREVVFRRVHPFDWDMDGIPNSIDDTPREPSPNTGYNQTDAWAMAAFPSNSAEIATMGYAAWVAARAADPNRRLVGLHVSSPNNAWPVCLTFGDLQMMCDGNEEIAFAIDCGARYTFSISGDGELDFLTLHGEVDDTQPCFANRYPYERWAGDVVAHLESPSSGWISRLPDVSTDRSDGIYLPPNSSCELTAVITNFHADALLGCQWLGGDGLVLSETNALETTIFNSPGFWTGPTNSVSFVASFVGGLEITNTIPIIAGSQSNPWHTGTVSDDHVWLTLSVPKGLACGGDAQLLMASFDSSVETNGFVVLQCRRGSEHVSMCAGLANDTPVAVSNRWLVTKSHRFLCALKGTSMSDYEGIEFSYSFIPQEGTNVEVTACSTVFSCYAQPVTTDEDSRHLIVNPSFMSVQTNAVFRVEVRPEEIPDSEVLWRAVEGRATFGGGNSGREIRLVDGAGTVDLEVGVLGVLDGRMHFKVKVEQ